MGRGERVSLEVRAAVEEAFVDEMDTRQANKVWATGCSSWYLNADGKNFSIWPGTTLAYLWRTARFDLENYVVAGGDDATGP